MKNVFALAAVALFAAACGPNCDTTAYEDKLTECGIDVPEVEGDDAAEEIECTQELADQVACQNDCTTNADCAAFDATNENFATAAADWAACLADCAPAAAE